MSYAQNTSVHWSATKAQIENMLLRRGAAGFITGWKENHAFLAFEFCGRAVRFTLPLPDRTDKLYTHAPNGKLRSIDAQRKAWEQACNSRWRAMFLVLKAKLEAVETGIVTFETEFLAHLQISAEQTVGEVVLPQLRAGAAVTLCLPGSDRTG